MRGLPDPQNPGRLGIRVLTYSFQSPSRAYSSLEMFFWNCWQTPQRIFVWDSLENQFQSGFSQRTVSGKPRIRDWNPNSPRDVLYKEINYYFLLLAASLHTCPLPASDWPGWWWACPARARPGCHHFLLSWNEERYRGTPHPHWATSTFRNFYRSRLMDLCIEYSINGDVQVIF